MHDTYIDRRKLFSWEVYCGPHEHRFRFGLEAMQDIRLAPAPFIRVIHQIPCLCNGRRQNPNGKTLKRPQSEAELSFCISFASLFESKDNPELKVYVEDALRLVLAARPERPLDLIDAYLQRCVPCRVKYFHWNFDNAKK